MRSIWRKVKYSVSPVLLVWSSINGLGGVRRGSSLDEADTGDEECPRVDTFGKDNCCCTGCWSGPDRLSGIKRGVGVPSGASIRVGRITELAAADGGDDRWIDEVDDDEQDEEEQSLKSFEPALTCELERLELEEDVIPLAAPGTTCVAGDDEDEVEEEEVQVVEEEEQEEEEEEVEVVDWVGLICTTELMQLLPLLFKLVTFFPPLDWQEDLIRESTLLDTTDAADEDEDEDDEDDDDDVDDEVAAVAVVAVDVVLVAVVVEVGTRQISPLADLTLPVVTRREKEKERERGK